MTKFDVKFCESRTSFGVGFVDNCEFEVEFSYGSVNIHTVEAYEGDYTIVPRVDEQSIPTAEKYMKNDLTVSAIPFFNVSNTSGGSTVYIGNEV